MESIEFENPIMAVAAKGTGQRRVTRACDQCNGFRSKCDGTLPCAHCVELALPCQYKRKQRKRGKVSRKELLQRQGLVATLDKVESIPRAPRPGSTSTSGSQEDTAGRPENRSPIHERSIDLARPDEPADAQPMDESPPRQGEDVFQENAVDQAVNQAIDTIGIFDDMTAPHYQHAATHPVNWTPPRQMPPSNAAGIIDPFGHADYPHTNLPTQGPDGAYPDGMESMPLPELPMSSAALRSPGGWRASHSPTAELQLNQIRLNPAQMQLRYPVLVPLLPHLNGIIPVNTACDLLEYYFQSSFPAVMRPASPYVFGPMFRKRSFLRQKNPRKCTPALLASMLWIACQTSELSILTMSVSSREKVSRKLFELTVTLLKPLVHSTFSQEPLAGSPVNGHSDGAWMGPIPQESTRPGPAESIDDVATYMHVATVISASENKAASLRWWNAAGTLARELKLNREVPSWDSTGAYKPDEAHTNLSGYHHLPNVGSGHGNSGGSPLSGMHQPSFEEREERRRIWWILFAQDRHLSLCYNRGPFLLDAECTDLLQPMDDAVWQAEDFLDEDMAAKFDLPGARSGRSRGPPHTCTGLGIFGFFLPLMTILGEIIDLSIARKHPCHGIRMGGEAGIQYVEAAILQQLDEYARSLRDIEARYSESNMERNGGPFPFHGVSTSVASPNSMVAEMTMQRKVVMAYGTHMVHTLHILLSGKWDPTSLLEDHDLWTSSPSFLTATRYAGQAAEALAEILKYDPDLSFIPYFFGIYLLQSSLIPLLVADKLQTNASSNIVKACETIVRAHEACVVTLNTKYQRDFRKVMRLALTQVHGHFPEENGEAKRRRREILSLYRWTDGGSGLALSSHPGGYQLDSRQRMSVELPSFYSMGNLSGLLSSELHPGNHAPCSIRGNTASAGLEGIVALFFTTNRVRLRSGYPEKAKLAAKDSTTHGREKDGALG